MNQQSDYPVCELPGVDLFEGSHVFSKLPFNHLPTILSKRSISYQFDVFLCLRTE